MNGIARRLVIGAFVVIAALAAVAATLVVTGQAGYVVTHGASMNPLYHQGDLVVVAKESHYRSGQIVAYRRPGESGVVLHRIVAGDAAGFVMKGDHNQSIDPTKPAASQVIGRAILHIPGGGTWLRRLTSPFAIGLIAFGLLAGGAGAQTRRSRNKRRSSMNRAGDTFPLGRVLANLLTPPLRQAALAAAVVGVLGLAFTGVGWSTPAQKSSTTTSATNRSVTFSYAATVTKTAAYDGTTVTAPEPIFRKLANTVDLHYAYRGAPSQITLAAKLSGPSGWRATIPLAEAGNPSAGDVRLDLNALDSRAKAAAEVTGIPQPQVTVAVTATVRTHGAKDFEASYPFTLTALQFTPAATSASNPTVKDITTVKREVRVDRAFSLVGQSISVNAVRSIGLTLLLLALIAGAGLAFLARKPGVSEQERIHRRHRSVLVPVEPITYPQAQSVVDVSDFETLTRLAKAYGLLVMYWNRGGAETFVLQEESTVYRYRSGRSESVSPIPAARQAADASKRESSGSLSD